jgi:4-amino-4-deoxy-L-arabinose transferase-like glycosyltransferase
MSPSLRALLERPWLPVALLLLPVVFALPPLPIDETRYLTVAWEMRQGGDFLVPHLNGELYAHKPPLLFWLINAGWSLTGVEGWTGRALALAYSLLGLVLIRRIVLRLGESETAARHAMWVMAGIAWFAVFSTAIMFDVLLAACVLVALLGVIDLADGRIARGVLVAGLGIGLGVLAKGPVALLDVVFAAASAPLWSATARSRPGRYYGAFALAIGLGAAIALAWAIPAALRGGAAYADAIFLKQTFGRVTESFAHRRPGWWYALILPPMLLPWPLVLRGRWAGCRQALARPAVRLGLIWSTATVLAFSFVSGKQGHYLLPVLPGFAIALGVALAHGWLRVRIGLLAIGIVVAGLLFAALPSWGGTRAHLLWLRAIWPGWGIAVAIAGAGLWLARARLRETAVPALAMLGLVLVFKLAIVQGTGSHYDPRAIAAEVRALQDRGVPLMQIGWHHGVYGFAGRLGAPVPFVLDLDALRAWASAHPDGCVIALEQRFDFRAEPARRIAFRGGSAAIWRVADLSADGFALENGASVTAEASPADED